MTTQLLGLTTRFTLTATSLGSRKDIVNRRVATDLGAVSEYVERTTVLPPNNSGGTNSASKRVFTDVTKYILIHSDQPLTLIVEDADGDRSKIPVENMFIATAAFASVEVVNLSQTATASVSVVCA